MEQLVPDSYWVLTLGPQLRRLASSVLFRLNNPASLALQRGSPPGHLKAGPGTDATTKDNVSLRAWVSHGASGYSHFFSALLHLAALQV